MIKGGNVSFGANSNVPWRLLRDEGTNEHTGENCIIKYTRFPTWHQMDNIWQSLGFCCKPAVPFWHRLKYVYASHPKTGDHNTGSYHYYILTYCTLASFNIYNHANRYHMWSSSTHNVNKMALGRGTSFVLGSFQGALFNPIVPICWFHSLHRKLT